VIRAFSGSRIDEALLLLLSHSNFDVVASIVGILINMSGASPSLGLNTKKPLSHDKTDYNAYNESKEVNISNIEDWCISDPNQALRQLTKTLKRSSLKNISLSALICQVLLPLTNSIYFMKRML
jgi:hypothetical protein